MLKILTTRQYDEWMRSLRDGVIRAQIAARIRRLQGGNFGDVEPIGEGVSELRIHFGPGYRIYFARQAEFVYVLLNGGDKKSQKRRDIAQAKALWAEIKRSTKNG